MSVENQAPSVVESIANDLQLSPADLEELVRRAPTADELPRLLEALGISARDLARVEPIVGANLERVCALCESKRGMQPRSGLWRFGRALSGILSERAEDCPTARDLVLEHDGPENGGADRHLAGAERPVTSEAETITAARFSRGRCRYAAPPCSIAALLGLFAFDRMVESWRFPVNHTTGACPRKSAGATWLARHSDTLQPNPARNHREKALRAENPSSSATDASERSRFST